MAHQYRHLLQALAKTPWAVDPTFGERALAVLQIRAAGGATPRAADPAPRPAPSGGSVMVLPVYGLLDYRLSAMDMACGDGGTSVAKLTADFDAALKNPDVKAILFEFDSPGGSVEGIPELATKILQARGTKPITAMVNTLCASAAYWLASACDEIVITPSGEAGSIGVFMLHVDESAADEQQGFKFTLIKAGKYKAEGMPFFPLPPDAQAAFQSRVDEWYDQFVKAVAKGRGVPPKAVRDGFGQGRTALAQEAVTLGLADRVATFEETATKLLGRSRSAGPKALDDTQVFLVEEPDAAAAAALADEAMPVALQIIRPTARGDVDLPAVPTAPATQAVAAKENEMDVEEQQKAVAEARKTEKERVRGLNALAQEHGQAVTAEQLRTWIDGETTAEDAQREILASYRAGTKANAPTGAHKFVAGDPNEGKRPFASLGEQLKAIRAAAVAPHATDPRLRHLNSLQAASGATEGSGSDAGFLLQPELVVDMLDPLYENGAIMSRLRRIPFSQGRNSLWLTRVEETSRASGSRLGGVQLFWKGEGDAGTGKRPKLGRLTLEAKKIIGLAFSSDESEEDAAVIEAVFKPAFQNELGFMVEDAVIRGTGAGQPLGIKSSDVVVEQAIEGGETLANFAQNIAVNVSKMLARVPGRMQNDVVFLYHPSVLPHLVTSTVGGTAAAPVFMPQGGLSGRPFDTILGRPAIMSEVCEAVGTPGDLIAAVLSEYVWADKGGPKEMVSLHLKFDTDEQAYRITYRCDGAPVWKTSVSPYKGADKLSPFVTLGARA